MLRHFPDAIRNFAYDRIALNRYKLFGRYSSQNVIKPDYPGRFLHPVDQSVTLEG